MNSSEERKQPARTSEFSRNLEIIRETQLFSGLPLEPLKVIAYLCTQESYKAGEYLFRQDDTEGQAFAITAGQAELVRATTAGSEVDLAVFGPGSFIGGLHLLADMRTLYGLRALSDIDSMVLTRERFAKVLEQFPAIAPKLLETVAIEIRAYDKRLLAEAEERGVFETATGLGVSLI